MTSILLIEDEERISTFVAKGLTAAGFSVLVAESAFDGFALAISGDIDLIILDIGLPDSDGFTLLHKLRSKGIAVPVIILTARSSVTDRVAGLEGGADDYLAKPFHFDELLARVRLRLRSSSTEDVTTLRVGELVLDLRSRCVEQGEQVIDLSAREFMLAETFFRHPRQVLSREQLLSRVWSYDFDPGSNIVDVYVGYLRRKIGGDHFETVRGMGYRMKP